MIPLDYITAWRVNAPWPQLSQIEQDLIICRALVELYNHPVVAKNLAFRSVTVLFKLHLLPARYSEDIDLVQMQVSGANRSDHGCRTRKDQSLVGYS